MRFYEGIDCLAYLWSNESWFISNSFSIIKPGCSGWGEGGGSSLIALSLGVESYWFYLKDSVATC